MSDIYDQLTETMEDVFGADDLELSADTSAADIDEWDSLNHIRFMIAVQNEFNVEFSTAEIGNLNNIGELVALIQSKS